MDQKLKLVIVIINYGTPELIKELVKNFLSSLPRFPKIRIDWVIADAIEYASFSQAEGLSGWQEELRREIKNKKRNFFHYFKIQNRGFASNVNLSLALFKKVQKDGYNLEKSDLILLLNPDTSLYWINLEKAIDFMGKKSESAVAGMALTSPKGQPEKWGHSTKFPILKYIGRKRFSEPSLKNKSTSVAWVSGGAMLIKYFWWQRLKGLDPGYFFYFEDVDFCRRVKDNGGKVYFLPQAIVNHRRGGSNISLYRRKMHYYAAEARYFHIYRSPSEYLLLRFIRFPYKLFYFARCYLVPAYWVESLKVFKESILCERKEGYPKFCALVENFTNVPLAGRLWLAVLILNLIVVTESVWGRIYLQSPLILHYNAYLGIDYYGDTISLFTFPLIAFLTSFFNFILGIVLLVSKRYAPFVVIPAGASLAFQLTIFGALMNLLIVNH